MNSQRNETIAKKFLAGSTTRELAEEYGVSHQRISQILHKSIDKGSVFKTALDRRKYDKYKSL